MDVLCLDLEGVLIPEIWVAVAERTGIDSLRKTTRDVPVYDDLMRLRLGILAERRIGLATIRSAIETLKPIARRGRVSRLGAKPFPGRHRLGHVL